MKVGDGVESPSGEGLGKVVLFGAWGEKGCEED